MRKCIYNPIDALSSYDFSLSLNRNSVLVNGTRNEVINGIETVKLRNSVHENN
jgi:hypothetical protein